MTIKISKQMLPLTLLFCAFAQSTPALANGEVAPERVVDPAAAARIEGTIDYLASDECAGRRVGTAGCELAAQYLEQQLEEIGVQPLPDSRGYRFGFSVTEGIQLEGEPRLELFGAGLEYGTDYTVASFSGSGGGAGLPLVFAGYGIVAPELDWNDYDGVSAEGAAVVLIRGEPRDGEAGERFGGDAPTVYSDLRRKAVTARDLGAAALIFVNNPFSDPEDELPELAPTYSAASFDIPVVHVRRELLVNALIGATGLSWHEITETMDLEYSPMPAVLGEAAVTIELEVIKSLATGFNLVGVIPGSDPELSEQYIVLGAHYDHLGIGGPESSRQDLHGQIHPGADDNASGVAAVLELARWAAEKQPPLRRSILITLFSAEEVGAIGSAALTKNSPVPHQQIVCMLNFDMVGRLRDNRLLLGGAGTALEFDELLAGLEPEHGVSFSQDRSGFGGSDHLNYMQYDNPVLFFFTGAHQEYHSPFDTADLVNVDGVARIAALAGDLVARIDARDETLTFQRPEGAPVSQRASRESISVSMGTIPSFEETQQPGYLLGDVRPGGPADEAGLAGGDIIIKIRDRRIASIYDFMFALEDVEPGQTVKVIYIRDGEEHEADVTLQARAIRE